MLYWPKHMAKFWYVLDILILNGLYEYRWFFNLAFHLPSNLIKNWKIGKIHRKSIILTSHTDFVLISTHFVCWGCHFTSSTKMHMTFFHILLNNLWKCFTKLRVMAQSKTFLFFRDFWIDLLELKNIFFLNVFGGWSRK